MGGARELEPRKQPVQDRSAATVAAILEGAARILERGGLAGFTTNAVAARAGVSVGSLYQYFPNKDAIVAALLERSWAELKEAVAAVGAADLGFDEGLARLVAAAVAHRLARPELERLLDHMENQLPLGARQAAAAETLQAEIIRFLLAHKARIGTVSPKTAAADTQAIARALIDAAAERGEIDVAAIESRVCRTVGAYLTG